MKAGKNGQENTTNESAGHSKKQGEALVRPDTSILKASDAVNPHLVYAVRFAGFCQHITDLHL